jgi:flavin-dependent dehydrogenase
VPRSDVLIVGGGPGGSSCAGELRRAGLSVTVLDRAAFPRDKLCAGWITPAVVEALALDLGAYAREGRTLQPITAFRTSVMGGPEVESRYPRPVSYGIRRCEFDHYLLRRSGACVVEGAAVTALTRAAGEWIVNGEYRAPLLVGAGGHFCPVARHLCGPAEEGVVAAQEIELPIDAELAGACPVRGEAPELFFTPDLKGYGWCFRKGDVLNVGLGRLDRQRLSAHVTDFLAYLVGRGRLPAGFPARWKGHAYLLYQTTRRAPVHEGALLVGDAAGLAYAPSGEGIRTAVESGLLAAQTILAAGGRYQREDLAPYGERLRARFGAPGPGLLGRLVPAGLLRALGRALLSTEWFSRRVVVDRWFLHTQQPALRLHAP